jgi:hypothetical protein
VLQTSTKPTFKLLQSSFAKVLVTVEIPLVKHIMSVPFQLKLVLYGMIIFLGSILLAVVASVQTLLQSLLLFLGLVVTNVLLIVVVPLQILTFPLWFLVWLVTDTVVVVYGVYYYWLPSHHGEEDKTELARLRKALKNEVKSVDGKFLERTLQG